MDLEELGTISMEEYWFDSAQDRDYWRAFVKAAVNLQVS
jgi:hypothetical protein